GAGARRPRAQTDRSAVRLVGARSRVPVHGQRRSATGLGSGRHRFLATPFLSPRIDANRLPDSARMVERAVETYQTVSGAAAVNASAAKPRKHEKLRWLGGGAAAIAGAFLFAWSIRRAGAEAVLSGVARVGAGFAVVFLLGGVRHLVRTLAW